MTGKRIDKIREIKLKVKKDKPFKNLSTKEKDALLEAVCKMLGLLPTEDE